MSFITWLKKSCHYFHYDVLASVISDDVQRHWRSYKNFSSQLFSCWTLYWVQCPVFVTSVYCHEKNLVPQMVQWGCEENGPLKMLPIYWWIFLLITQTPITIGTNFPPFEGMSFQQLFLQDRVEILWQWNSMENFPFSTCCVDKQGFSFSVCQSGTFPEHKYTLSEGKEKKRERLFYQRLRLFLIELSEADIVKRPVQWLACVHV